MFPDEICSDIDLYLRSESPVKLCEKGVYIQKNQSLRTDTYMNIFDIDTWKKYSELTTVRLKVCLQGKGRLDVKCTGKEESVITSFFFETANVKETIQIPILDKTEGQIFFEVTAEEESYLYTAVWLSDIQSVRQVRIAAIICTYKRHESLKKILDTLQNSLFFQQSELEGSLMIRVVDNARELGHGDGKCIKIYPNCNTGGSGGFARGMEETVREEKLFAATHVLLMDDDVLLQIESLYRLFALLSLIQEQYHLEVIAGRMFRLDNRKIQYTAAEIWNGGDLKHIGWNNDMTEKNYLLSMNDSTGAEYGGWWFCCYPIEFVRKNRPLPFFLHCDDVEYGIRHGGTPIILNGIQVWHETYEYRIDPIMTYYDIRNTLVVNVLWGKIENSKDLIRKWKEQLTEFHNNGCQDLKYLCTLAMWHFSRGRIFERSRGRLPSHCIWLSKKKTILKFVTPVFHRVAENRVEKQFLQIVKKYKGWYEKNCSSAKRGG